MPAEPTLLLPLPIATTRRFINGHSFATAFFLNLHGGGRDLQVSEEVDTGDGAAEASG